MYRVSRSIFCLLLAALCALGLSSCVLETHQRVLDTAREYDGIVLLHDAVYQQGNRFFVKGVQTTLRRSNRLLMHCPTLSAMGTSPERTGVYTILQGAPCKTVYREFRLKNGHKPFDKVSFARYPMGYSFSPPDDDAEVWPDDMAHLHKGKRPYYNKKGQVIAWYEYALEDFHTREYTGDWVDKLPAGARPILLTAEQIANHPVLKGEHGVGYACVWNLSEARMDSVRALYAYPLAGVCWLVPDAAATVAMHVPFLPLFIWEGIYGMYH